MWDELLQIIATSLKIAFLSTVLVMITSFFLANFFVSKNGFWVRALEIFTYLPLALPPVALGYMLLAVFGRKTFLGHLLHQHLAVDLAFSAAGAVLAAFMVSLGIGVRACRVALENIDHSLLEMARLCGASPWQIIFYIKLPLCRRALLGGAILVFARSMGEFGATMVFAGNTLGETRTLALAIWTDMQMPNKSGQAFWLVMITVLIAGFALIFSEVILRPRKKSM